MDNNELVSKMLKVEGLGTFGGPLSSLFGRRRNPYSAASAYLDQIPGMSHEFYDPYIQAGRTADTGLSKTYADLMSDPGSIMAQIGRGYKESPGFQFQRNQGLNAINNAAAAGGMMGTMSHQQDAGDLATNLANADYGNYMKDALSMWNTGLAGEQGISDRGYQAGTNLNDILASLMEQRAGLKYQDVAGRNQQRNDMFSNLMSGAAAMFML